MAGFMKLAGVFKENRPAIFNLIQGWWFFRHTEVVVGITEESNSGRGSINNAELLYLHEMGVPSHNIPSRPVLKPAIAQASVSMMIAKLMKDAAEEALVYGDKERARQCFEKAGMAGRDACKSYIAAGVPPPNKPSTIARKGSSRPLIDTGSMMGAITYAVRKK